MLSEVACKVGTFFHRKILATTLITPSSSSDTLRLNSNSPGALTRLFRSGRLPQPLQHLTASVLPGQQWRSRPNVWRYDISLKLDDHHHPTILGTNRRSMGVQRSSNPCQASFPTSGQTRRIRVRPSSMLHESSLGPILLLHGMNFFRHLKSFMAI